MQLSLAGNDRTVTQESTVVCRYQKRKDAQLDMKHCEVVLSMYDTQTLYVRLRAAPMAKLHWQCHESATEINVLD